MLSFQHSVSLSPLDDFGIANIFLVIFCILATYPPAEYLPKRYLGIRLKGKQLQAEKEASQWRTTPPISNPTLQSNGSYKNGAYEVTMTELSPQATRVNTHPDAESMRRGY